MLGMLCVLISSRAMHYKKKKKQLGLQLVSRAVIVRLRSTVGLKLPQTAAQSVVPPGPKSQLQPYSPLQAQLIFFFVVMATCTCGLRTDCYA